MQKAKIFISYSRADSEFVLELAEKLRSSGVHFWLDQLDTTAGQHWDRAIEEALETSELLLVILSPASVNSDNVLDEVSYALEEKKQIVPVLYQKCVIPFRLRRLHYLDFTGDFDRALTQLLNALNIKEASKTDEDDQHQRQPTRGNRQEEPREAADAVSQRKTAGKGLPLHSFEFETVTIDEKGRIIERRKEQARCFVEDLGGGMKLEMVEIPGGSFLMGSPESEAERGSDEGPHQVTVSPFYMGKFEVTQAQWRAVANLPKMSRDLNPDPSQFKGDNRPVEQVSWEEAVEFCERLSKKSGKRYRLPTEAEWEYACRAGTKTPFAFGETITPEIVNYDGNYPYGKAQKGAYRERTVDVGSLGVANGFGLYDMHGNVWEWCMDWYSENYYSQSPGVDPTGPASGSARVVRGGGWYGVAQDLRSAVRYGRTPDDRVYSLGFRLVRTYN